MRFPLFATILFFAFVSTDVCGQGIVANTCDSTVLTKEEFERCMADSAWNGDIIVATNYITSLKTDVLPRYRKLRQDIRLSEELQHSIVKLRKIYDTVLNRKLLTYLVAMDRNQRQVQPKAYLSSVLSLETFRIYPDVYAILLNEIHLELSPQTSVSDLRVYKELVNTVLASIQPDLYKRLEQVTASLQAENERSKRNGFSPLLQGVQTEEQKKKYQIVNFLLWTE